MRYPQRTVMYLPENTTVDDLKIYASYFRQPQPIAIAQTNNGIELLMDGHIGRDCV